MSFYRSIYSLWHCWPWYSAERKKENINLGHFWHAFSVVSKLLKQQETVYSVCWRSKNKLQNCEMWCSTGIGCKTSLFLLYINDFQFASDLLDPIMFVDDANLFYSNKDVKMDTVFLSVNDELQKINVCFISIKLSRNVKKINTRFSTNPAKKMIFR